MLRVDEYKICAWKILRWNLYKKLENCTKDKLECLDVKYDYYTMTCIYEFYGQIYTNK